MKIGIASFLEYDQNQLKRQYLLLDKLHLDGFQEIRNIASGSATSGITGLEIPMSIAYIKAIKNEDLQRYLDVIRPDIEFLRDDGFLVDFGETNIGQGVGLELLDEALGINPWKLEDAFDITILRKMQHFSTRLKSHILRQQIDYDFIPFVGEPLSSNSNDNKSVVISVVLDNFPIINPSLPWVELSQFKQEFELDHLRLKNYINSLSREDFNLYEIEEKVEYDLHELKKRYQFFNIDYDTGILKIYLVMTAKFFEKVLKKELVNATEMLFNIRETKTQLLKSELDIPNNDLSYIVKVQKRLS